MPQPFGPGEWELFNLKQDPAELTDLSTQHPEKLEGMIALWEQYKADNGVLDITLDVSDKFKRVKQPPARSTTCLTGLFCPTPP